MKINIKGASLSVANSIINIIDEFDRMADSYSLEGYFYASVRRGRRIRKKERQKQRKQQKEYYSSLAYLKKQNYIKEIKKGNKKYYKLTPKGDKKNLFIQTLVYSQQNKNKVKNKKLLKHLVIFDIPERERRFRTLFRRCLYNLGYDLVQKSCFISNDAGSYDLIKQIVEDYKFEKYIQIFKIK